jgi:hypothetical protein
MSKPNEPHSIDVNFTAFELLDWFLCGVKTIFEALAETPLTTEGESLYAV